MDVSIILCTFDRCELLPAVVDDLLSLEEPPDCEWEIVIVDNNSTDDTAAVVAELVQRHPGRIRSFFEPRQGKSFALNLGVKSSEAEFLLFTDDDVRVDAGWMKAMVERFRGDRRCMGIGGRLLPILPEGVTPELDEDEIRTYHSFDFGDDPMILRNNPFGDNMAYRREAFVKYGLFRTDLGPTASDRGGLSEDSEFARRLMDAGQTVCYEPRAIVHHYIRAERLTVDYLDRWHFQYGRALWRREEHPEKVASLFSVPRYLLRQLLLEWLRWLTAPSAKERRHRHWRVQLLRGRIHEARHGDPRSPSMGVESYEGSRNRP